MNVSQIRHHYQIWEFIATNQGLHSPIRNWVTFKLSPFLQRYGDQLIKLFSPNDYFSIYNVLLIVIYISSLKEDRGYSGEDPLFED